MCTYRHDDDDVDATQNCRMSGSVEQFTNIDITSMTETYRMSESVELITNIGTARPQCAVEDVFTKTPDLQYINRLFAQIDILHQKLIKIWSRDTLICERVLGNLTPTPPGGEFWMVKIRIDYAGHRKMKKKNKGTGCR